MIRTRRSVAIVSATSMQVVWRNNGLLSLLQLLVSRLYGNETAPDEAATTAAVRYWVIVTLLDCRDTRMSRGPSTATTKQSNARVASVSTSVNPARSARGRVLNAPLARARHLTS